MKPKFSTLIVLTIITIGLLLPFVFSPVYIPMMRETHFDILQILQGEIYKQITGYLSLIFVILEMVLTARKRGRTWKFKMKIPGSIQFWRILHIFLGVGLLGTTVIHTIGAQGLNFNAVFLWVFFGVTLSALVGVVAETGFLESPIKFFRFAWQSANSTSEIPGISKGKLIINMRLIWLNTHIFLVSVFCVMLIFHIFIAYFYQ
ncbi:hypothetical protein [Okeania sp.]|uniref:hypothetical protein n=1 Tax=Okeania sp. TaxID=3100323 RepID=UPI002B4AF0BD|nr:hypothetical protein [Okeania sp.]MEB3342075.1 hypothetical protein [Okeania sp.]